MRIVIAPDSFKESLSAEEVCASICKGIKKVFPRAKLICVPMADGGEGTADAILSTSQGRRIFASVTGPLGKKVSAYFGFVPKTKTAIVEMAQASGLSLVHPHQRNPMKTTSFGTGELISRALNIGAKKIILTLGGVATNDGGVGIAEALGYRFWDARGKKIARGAEGLKNLDRIDGSSVHPALNKTEFVAACDVKNPLCGANGSAAVYGPQKGATSKMIKEIDSALRHFAGIVERDLVSPHSPLPLRERMKVRGSLLYLPGAGAAGGAGAGAVAFLNAELRPGVEIVIEATGLNEKMKGADLVITGEGKIDSQTIFGKTPAGVAKTAKKYGIPVIAFCGKISDGYEKVHSFGIDAVFSITDGPISYAESLENAEELLEKSSQEAMRFLKAVRRWR